VLDSSPTESIRIEARYQNHLVEAHCSRCVIAIPAELGVSNDSIVWKAPDRGRSRGRASASRHNITRV
jgi:hypothetical protein